VPDEVKILENPARDFLVRPESTIVELLADRTNQEEQRISDPRTNDRIRVPEVRLVGPNGEQVGVVRIEDAIRLAQEADLDLVEVAPNSKPPVAKIMDFGKFKYETAQKAKEARRNQANTILKEVRFRLKIDVHDYETKRKRAEGFLKAGDKVKAMILFRGREQSRPEQGVRLLQRFAEDVAEVGTVESTPMIDGRNMVMVIGPLKNKAEAKAEADAKRAASKPPRSERPDTDAEPAAKATPVAAPVENTAPIEKAEPAEKLEAAPVVVSAPIPPAAAAPAAAAPAKAEPTVDAVAEEKAAPTPEATPAPKATPTPKAATPAPKAPAPKAPAPSAAAAASKAPVPKAVPKPRAVAPASKDVTTD
jgi:translation initiation factor IF-3